MGGVWCVVLVRGGKLSGCGVGFGVCEGWNVECVGCALCACRKWSVWDVGCGAGDMWKVVGGVWVVVFVTCGK